mmetsp:Transcript_18572/g.39878  ORF Transcript_18572/g.39878 Transcript_18572/m.39878 type:complete len:110 (-) Transcript_18572:38-367(-)
MMATMHRRRLLYQFGGCAVCAGQGGGTAGFHDPPLHTHIFSPDYLVSLGWFSHPRNIIATTKINPHYHSSLSHNMGQRAKESIKNDNCCVPLVNDTDIQQHQTWLDGAM